MLHIVNALAWIIALVAALAMIRVVYRQRADPPTRVFIYMVVALSVILVRNTAWAGANLIESYFYLPSNILGSDSLRHLWPIDDAVVAVFAATGLHFFLVFPVRHPILTRRYTLAAIYVPAVLLAVAWLGHLVLPNPWRISNHILDVAETIYIVFICGLGLVTLVRSYRGTRSPALQLQAYWLAWGVGIGSTLALVTNLVPSMLMLPRFSDEVPVMEPLPLLIMLLAFAMGLIRYRGLDITLLIQNSLVYTVLTGMLLALYMLFSSILVPAQATPERQYFLLISLAIALVAFPLRAAIQAGVNRIINRKQENYQRAIQQFSHWLNQTKSLGQVAKHTLSIIERTLRPAGLALILRQGNVLVVESCTGLNTEIGQRYSSDSGLATWLAAQRRPLYLPLETEWLFSLSAVQRQAIEEAQIDLYIPLYSNEQLHGWLALGHPKTSKTYLSEDIDFAMAISDQASIALEVTRLVSKLEQRVSQLSVLNEIGQALSSSLRTEELLEVIYQQVGRLMDATNLYIALHDKETDTVSFPLYVQDGQRGHTASRQAGRGMTECVIHHQHPILLKRREDELAYQPEFQTIGTQAHSWLGVPMLTHLPGGEQGEQVIGVITVQQFEIEEAYTEDDLEVLSIIASQAAVAIANARLYEQTDQALARRVEELSNRNQQLGEILRLGNALKANVELEQILDRVVRAVSSSLGFNIAVVSLVYDTPQPHLKRVAAAGIPSEAWERMRDTEIPQQILTRLMQDEFRISQSYLVRPTATSNPALTASTTLLTFQHLDTKLTNEDKWHPGDALFVLLTDVDGKPLGVLSVEDPVNKHIPSHETIETLEVFANQAAIAIENARQFRDRARRITELSKLHQTSLALAFSTETDDVLRYISEQARELTESDSTMIFLYNSQTDSFIPAIAIGDPLPEDRGSQIRPTGMTRRAIVERRSFIVADTTLEQDLNPTVHQAGICSLICMPLISKGQVQGVMYVNSQHPHKYTDDNVQLVSALASQAAVAIENGQLFKHLAEGRDRLQAVLDSTREGIMMLDTSGQIVFTNAMFGEIFNTSPALLIGRRLLDVVAEHTAPPDETLAAMMDVIYEALSELAQQNNAIHKSNVTVEHPPLYIERVSSPVFNEAGITIGRLLTLRDVTEEKKAEALREDLMRMMVHDLRSPLTSILGSLQVLEMTLQDEYNKQAVQIALSSSNRLLNLINALLDINKMEAGQMPIYRQKLNWQKLVNEAVERARPLAANEHVSLAVELPANLPTTYADENILARVLSNLLDNAIKFSPQDTTITLTIIPPDENNEFICQVSDAGPGIPPEYHNQIFEKFFQVPSNTGKRRGTGLGLAFCRLAVEAHGGYIWVESEPGHGSTFIFTLPIGKPPELSTP